MHRTQLVTCVLCATVTCGSHLRGTAQARSRPSVYQTTLEEPNQLTPEITTEELVATLAAKSEPVFDVRTAKEYAIAHIPARSTCTSGKCSGSPNTTPIVPLG